MQPKEIRKNANHIALGLILYTMIWHLTFRAESLLYRIYANLTESSPEAQNNLFQHLTERSYRSGISSIAAVTIGVVLLLLYAHKKLPPKAIFHREQAMSGKMFPLIICVLLSGQLIYSLAGNFTEFTLNLFGFTAMEQLQAASSQSATVSMLLYSGLFAPIAEELIYRGFVLRSLEQYGKVFAITVSAAWFGIMHGNIYQMLYAFLVGIVLGYTALTYSIRWSILLHIINNLIFGNVLSWMLSGCSPTAQDYIYRGINIVFFALSSYILLKNREHVVRYIKTNRTSKTCWLHTFTAIGVILFIAFHLTLAISGIHRLVF